jgi:hypothetical protein
MGLQWTEECQFLAERFERQLALSLLVMGVGGRWRSVTMIRNVREWHKKATTQKYAKQMAECLIPFCRH